MTKCQVFEKSVRVGGSVLPASLVSALGMSLAYIPVLTAAVSKARKEQTGLASGLVNTSYQIGSALGLAIIVAVASSSQTETPENNSGVISLDALNSSFDSAFIGTEIISVIAAIIAVLGLKIRQSGRTTAVN